MPTQVSSSLRPAHLWHLPVNVGHQMCPVYWVVNLCLWKCFGINTTIFNFSKDFKIWAALSFKQGLKWHILLLAVLVWFPQKSANFPVVLLLMDNFLFIRVQGLYPTCASSATCQKMSDEKHYERHSVLLQIYHMIANQMGRMALQIDFE